MEAVDKKIICKPRLKWKPPPKIALNHNWHVAVGEESEEAKNQKHRERKIPEVVYRRRSRIPSSPSEPRNVQEDPLDESQIPVIPLTPIEEDEPTEENNSLQKNEIKIKPSTLGEPAVEVGSSTQADVALAAATVVTALMKSKESGSCIDTDLLVKIFSDPKAVEKLIGEVGPSSTSKKLPVLEASSKSDFEIRKKADGNISVTDKENAFFCNPGEIKCDLAAFDNGAAPVHRPNSLSSQFTFFSQPDPVVQISDLDDFKWTDNGYGVATKTNIEPVIGSNLFTPEVTIPKPNENLIFPARMNVYPDFKLKAVLSDAVRATDSQLMSASPYMFPNQIQPNLQNITPVMNNMQFLNRQPNLQNIPPVPNNMQFMNPLQPGAQIMGLSGVNAQPQFSLPNAVPRLQDQNYFKALVQQHGNMQQAQDYNSLRFHQENAKPVPYFDTNLMAMKIQRPCFFFNRPEGCKHGYSCPYIHDQPQNMQLGSVMGGNSSKRMKFGGEIFGVQR